VDETGRLLADGARNDGATGVSADERQLAYERRLREQVEEIVSSVVGPGRARVQLTADFDFNRVTQTSEKYDPEGRVMRSSQTREESSTTATTTNNNKDGQVTVANELPGANQQGNPASDQSKKTEEVVNYEISRSTKTEVTEGGRVNRISVAVLVDGSYGKNDKGEPVYQPRNKEEMDRIAALVRTAIGFDQKRGDQVEVVNLRFADVPASIITEPTGLMSYLQFTKDDIMRGVELLVMGMLGLLVLLMVVRPLLRRAIAPDPPPPPAAVIAAAIAGGNVQEAIAAGATADDIKAVPSQTSKMIDIAQVQGQVHAQSVQKVGELADKNPNETVSIIRTWLHEAGA
jgi:flagellar M-ring protein FliF